MNIYNGKFTEASKAKHVLNGIIDGLFKSAKETTREQRIEVVRSVTDTYINEMGETPETTQLERLATLILNEEYTDRHPDKMSREEYPILTESQRVEREKTEVSEEWSAEVGSDGVDYRPQTRDTNRKMRQVLRNELRDKDAHARNKERRKKYREFTKVQPVHTYYIDPPNNKQTPED